MLIKIWASEKGISLIEIVLAMMLLGVAVAGLIAALATGLRVSQVVEEQSTSATLVTSQVEEFLSRPFNEPVTPVPASGDLSLSVTTTSTPPYLRQITVTVSMGHEELSEELFSVTTRKVNTE